ncbi:cytochrome P450 4V2 [Trichonephila clavipes]|nr:cytochrome P450 4V2 [Trichonephila clavipes]
MDKDFSVIKKPLSHVALDIICETMLGSAIGALEDADMQHVKAVRRLTDMFMNKVFKFWLWPFFIFRFSSYYKEVLYYVTLYQDLARSALKERKEEYLSKNKTKCKKKRTALIDALLKLHLESQELSEEDVVEEIITFILAGYETVAMSLTWALYLIGLYPDVQEKIQEEIDKVFGEEIDRDITEDDLNQLNYLNCVLMESNRIYTTVPMFGRESLKDTVICGHTIPKGASCLVLSYFLHKDENVFPDPEKFDPDRFSPENSTKIPEGAYVPFSVGQRNCIEASLEWLSCLCMDEDQMNDKVREPHVSCLEL